MVKFVVDPGQLLFLVHFLTLLTFASMHEENTVPSEGQEPTHKSMYFATKTHCSSKGNECWGYEENCKDIEFPFCSKDEIPNEKKRQDAIWRTWSQLDYGLISQIRGSFLQLCKAKTETDSSFTCSPNLMYCRAKNFYVDFSTYDFYTRDPFNKIPYEDGQIGGRCQLDKDLLDAQNKYRVNLGTWYNELENFAALDFQPLDKCDVVVQKPTIFVKLDFAGNLYHHFCDFISIFISQHVNGSSFSKDINIINWSASNGPYRDKLFGDTWKVFTDHSLQLLNQYRGKKVCFRDAVFSIPPRHPQTLYYNNKVPDGCRRSRLMRTFSDHILNGLKIPKQQYKEKEIRVTFLRRTTKFRKVYNEQELLKAASKIKGVSVSLIDYKDLPFLSQLERTVNTDIMVGMHGAGLAHFMFLPEWAVGYELFNCHDVGCYKNMALLSGVHYMTWEDESKFEVVERHDPDKGPKFWNYRFDVSEFTKLLRRAVKYVKNNRPARDTCE